MKKSLAVLPDHYKSDFTIDLKNNMKQAVWLNVSSVLVVLPFVGI